MRRAALLLPVLAALLYPAGASATFPGSNGDLIFQSALPGDLFAIGAQGGPARPILRAGVSSDAMFSPDGARIVFTTAKNDSSPAQIAVANADGTAVQVLTHLKTFGLGASFSPDGQRIVYATDEGAPPPRDKRLGPPLVIHVMNADGSGDRRLFKGNRDAQDPVFSPDGTKIAVSLVRPDAKRQYAIGGVTVMNADGTGAHALPLPKGAQGFNPSWSPDGTKLAFELQYQPTSRKSNIAIVNADGSGLRRLAVTKWWETNPVFSPDGTRIAFTSDRDTRPTGSLSAQSRLNTGFELYTVGVDGSGLTRLTNNAGAELFPDWQPLPAAP